MKNTVLIIVPRYIPAREKTYYEFPLGLAYISACLKRAGYPVEVLNLNHNSEDQQQLIQQKIAATNATYVLSGGLSAHYKQLTSIVADVRNTKPSAIPVIGGGGVTATPELMFNHILPDYIVIGEGELTIVELLDALEDGGQNLTNIHGIGYRNRTGDFVTTTSRGPIMDLDSIPWPDLDGFEFETFLEMQQPNDNLYLYPADKPRFFPIISSRGCLYNCTFCYHPLGQRYRSRSVDDFIKEVEFVVEKYEVNNLAIVDELMSADRKRLYEICERLKKLPKKVNWMCQLRVDSVDEDMLKQLKEAGCFIISYGFESASDKILESMNKHITAAKIERALELTRKAGIGIQGYFIFGDPEETMETAIETLNFWKKHGDYHITMGYIRQYPGSELWKREIQLGHLNSPEAQLKFLDKCIEAPLNLSKMSPEEWFELQKEVQKAIILNNHYGKLISSKKVSENNYSIVFECSHCGEINTYHNFHQRILGVFKIVCRKCNQAQNLSPMAFEHVQQDFERNNRAYEQVMSKNVPVIVTPCMNEAEFSAMADIFLPGVTIEYFMDINQEKTHMTYLGHKVLKRTLENVQAYAQDHFFVIPLTRFANRIFKHLIACGVDSTHICRLDEVTGPLE
jgi:anaerobic magnesium-protoporphyrin IX monomethyl ester cyclase